MRGNLWVLAACSIALVGCGRYFNKDKISQSISAEIARSNQMFNESMTLSRLTALESSLSDYIRAKKTVPKKLDELIPDYLAEIPDVVLGIKGHKETNEVRYYSPDVISGGVINGAAIKDQGGWGYSFDGERVIIFVNCTHPAPSGQAWYRLGSGLGLGSTP